MSGRQKVMTLFGVIALSLLATSAAQAAPKVVLAEDFGYIG